MRPSTLAELIGFGAIAYAVSRVNLTAAIAVGGLFLLLIAYATEDDAVAVSVVRMVSPARIRWERAKARHHEHRDGRRERRETRQGFLRRQSEVVLRVKAD